jgi:hypothetical protein
MKKIRLKHIIGIIGVLVTICGWTLSNADRFPFIYNLLAPEYLMASKTFKNMHVKQYILNKNDPGFDVISELIKSHLAGKIKPEIKFIKTINWGWGLLSKPGGLEDNQYIELEIHFENTKSTTGSIYGLKSEITKKYLTNKLFTWSNFLFWFGILVTLVSVFL